MKIPKILIILFFALLLRLIFFTGFSGSDDYLLVKAADDLNKGRLDFHETNHIPLRLALLYPAGFSIQLFGINDLALALFPLFCSLGIILFTYLIGKKLLGEPVGLLAAFLLSFFPLEVLHGSIFVAEPVAGFFFLIAVYLLLLDTKVSLFFGGIFLGLSYLAKELYLLTLPLLLIYLFYRKKKISLHHFLFFFGFLLIFLGELLFFFSSTGNLFFRQETAQYFAALFTPDQTMIWREVFFRYPLLVFNPINFQVGLFFYLFTFAFVFAIIKKIKPLYPMIFFSLFFLLYLNFGSTQFSEYTPLPRSLRYFMIASPSLAILSSVFLLKIKKYSRIWIFPLLLGILFLSALLSSYFASRALYETPSFISMESVQDYLHTPHPVYIDQNNYKNAQYLTQFNNQKQIFSFRQLPKNLTQLQSGFVFVDYEMMKRDISFGNSSREEFFNFLETSSTPIQETSSYHKKGCAFLSHSLFAESSFFRDRLDLGCKRTEIAVFFVNNGG